jgi:hypothetical protein
VTVKEQDILEKIAISVKIHIIIYNSNRYQYNWIDLAQFRKTCEELALLGYTKPDVYLIDIDGNGKFPPAHVKCEFGAQGDSKTIVEHNLPSQIVK